MPAWNARELTNVNDFHAGRAVLLEIRPGVVLGGGARKYIQKSKETQNGI